MWTKIRPYVGFSVLALLAGGLSGVITQGEMEAFSSLRQPPLSPPGWVFSVAWTILYFLLGWALYLVFVNTRKNVSKIRAYILFGVQLVLNGLWSYVFFGANMPGFALVILLGLFVASVWMAREFFRIVRRTAYMIIPYILWLMFAFYMNAYILLMN